MGVDEKTGIWSLSTHKKRTRFDFLLLAKIGILWSEQEKMGYPRIPIPKKAADLGCGIGKYCSVLKAYGWPIVHGYEGAPDIKEIAVYDDIMVTDLSKRRWVDIDYDFVLCLEVGEHIPKEHEQVFIDNVCEFTHKDLVLSWALPGFGGKGHFNEQPNEYVISEFTKRGLVFDEETSNDLRKCTFLKWFEHTIMVFSLKGI